MQHAVGAVAHYSLQIFILPEDPYSKVLLKLQSTLCSTNEPELMPSLSQRVQSYSLVLGSLLSIHRFYIGINIYEDHYREGFYNSTSVSDQCLDGLNSDLKWNKILIKIELGLIGLSLAL